MKTNMTGFRCYCALDESSPSNGRDKSIKMNEQAC